jgi:hypothetical protein
VKKKIIKKKKNSGKKNEIPGNEKKFRFLGIFMDIPSFSKFRRNIPAKKFEKFRTGIPSFSDTHNQTILDYIDYRKYSFRRAYHYKNF